MSTGEAERIIKDIKESLQGKTELCYKDFVDFLTKRRVNVQMQEKGFVDPLLASSVQALCRVKDSFDLTT